MEVAGAATAGQRRRASSSGTPPELPDVYVVERAAPAVINLLDGDREAAMAQHRSSAEDLHDAIETLVAIFPTLTCEAARMHLSAAMDSLPLQAALEVVLERFLSGDCPTPPQEVSAAEGLHEAQAGDRQTGPRPLTKEELFQIEPPPPEAGQAYADWCLLTLSNEFPTISKADLRRALKAHAGRIAPTHSSLMLELQRMAEADSASTSGTEAGPPTAGWLGNKPLVLTKRRRRLSSTTDTHVSIQFEAEWSALQRLYVKDQELHDMQLAKRYNDEQYEKESQHIECGCCCGEFSFEDMVQCADGHLFCFGCLRRRIEESTFGGMSATGALPCMATDGCDELFPSAEVRRALPAEILDKYEQRQAQFAVQQAGLVGLVYCPFCDFAVELHEDQRVLDCPNQSCLKSSCRQCREASHLPFRCEEIEKKSETNVRTRIEEVVCRCMRYMCYVCREPVKDYNHFCQHPLNPGDPCSSCKKCPLFFKENEEMVVNKAKETALDDELLPNAARFDKPVGPPENLQTTLKRTRPLD
eukprot:SM000065S20218  [mRNA]  locus=s65:374034:377781:- [translate_table: standard]